MKPAGRVGCNMRTSRSTLVVYESLKQYAANLPVAKFRA